MEEKSDSKPTTFSEISMETLQSMPLHELVRLQRVIQQEISTRLNSNQPTTPQEDIIETPKAEVPEESVKKGIFQNTSIITGKIKATATRFIKPAEVWPVQSWQQHAHRDVIWDANICTCALEKKGVNFGTCSADGTAKIWNINETTDQVSPLCCYTGHSGSVNSIEFHPTQQLVVTASGDSTCQVWKPSIRASDDSEATENEQDARSVSMLPTPSFSRSRRVNDSQCGTVAEPLVSLPTNGVSLYAVWNASGNRLLTASQEICKIWDLSRSEAPLQILTGHDKSITHISPHPTHPSLFVTSSNDCTLRLWDMRSATFMVNVFHGHQKPVSCSHFVPSKNVIISGGDDCALKIWDLNTSSCSRTIYTSYNENRFSLSRQNDICVPSNKGTAVIYNFFGDNIGILSTDMYNQRKMILKCCWCKDRIITCGIDRSIAVWKNPVQVN